MSAPNPVHMERGDILMRAHVFEPETWATATVGAICVGFIAVIGTVVLLLGRR